MKRIIFLLLIGLVCLEVTSCKKSLLDQVPQTSYTSATVWSDLNLVQVYVNQLYQDDMPMLEGGNGRSLFNMADISGDCFIRFNYANAIFIQNGEIAPDNQAGFADIGIWSNFWNVIRRCNIFFQKINEVPGDSTLRQSLVGQVHFLRAWAYFSLIKRYGGVPIIEKVFTVNDSSYQVGRKSYDDCVQYIVADLDSSAATLPILYSSKDDLGRATKGAALGLKSRVLLFAASELNNPSQSKSKWELAADAAKEVIDMPEYHLYQGDDYGQMFLEKSYPGLVFARYGTTNPDHQTGPKIQLMESPNGLQGWSTHAPSQNLVDQFYMKDGTGITDPNSGYDPAHPYENRDPRFYADIVYNNSLLYGQQIELYEGGKSSSQGIDNWNASLTGYTLRKFFDESIKISDANFAGTTTPLIRFAEIYLNYAEAEYHLGNESIARAYIDSLRERPSIHFPALPSSLSGVNLLNEIRRERRIELCFEGHHYWDLLRWKLAMQDLNGTLDGMTITKHDDGSFSYKSHKVIDLTFKERMYRFPLPLTVIQKSDLKQNPGYE